MKTTKVVCDTCGKKFDKLNKEIKRCKKKGFNKNFCNRGCSGIYSNHLRTPDFYREHSYNISQHAGNQQDEYSPFRPYLNKGRFSNRKHKNELSLDYLKYVWEKQNGICPYTGIKMILARNTREYQKIRSMKKASLDRIDSSKGYIEGNVEFVCMAVNNAKNSFTKEDMKEFLHSIEFSVIHS